MAFSHENVYLVCLGIKDLSLLFKIASPKLRTAPLSRYTTYVTLRCGSGGLICQINDIPDNVPENENASFFVFVSETHPVLMLSIQHCTCCKSHSETFIQDPLQIKGKPDRSVFEIACPFFGFYKVFAGDNKIWKILWPQHARKPRVKNDVSDVVEATSIPPCSSSSSRARWIFHKSRLKKEEIKQINI